MTESGLSRWRCREKRADEVDEYQLLQIISLDQLLALLDDRITSHRDCCHPVHPRHTHTHIHEPSSTSSFRRRRCYTTRPDQRRAWSDSSHQLTIVRTLPVSLHSAQSAEGKRLHWFPRKSFFLSLPPLSSPTRQQPSECNHTPSSSSTDLFANTDDLSDGGGELILQSSSLHLVFSSLAS